LVILLTFMLMAVEAIVYNYGGEVLTPAEVIKKESEGWEVQIWTSGSSGFSYPNPVVNEPFRFEVHVDYSLSKRIDEEDSIDIRGPCADELVLLDIYKYGEIVDKYKGKTNSEGDVVFTVIFRESGYYASDFYTAWERQQEYFERVREVRIERFYVDPEPTPKPTPTSTPATPKPTPTSTPTTPTTPTSTPTPTIPAFQITPAIMALLAVACLLKRKK